MKLPAFRYVAPATLEEAVSVLAEHGDEAKVLSGGQSLVPMMAFRLATPAVIVDVNRLSGLGYLREEGDGIVMGALARHRDVEEIGGLASRCAMVSEAVALVGHVAIRNRGTVAGSLAHADPAAEWPALLLALGGEVEVRGPNGTRTISASDLLVTYFTTSIAPDEMVTSVRLPIPGGPRVGSAFVEMARRHGDFAIAGAGALLALGADGMVTDARIALIGVREMAVRAAGAERVLIGERPSDEHIAEAAEAVDPDIDPVSDLHGSSEYRRHLAKVLTRRALSVARGRAGG